MSKENNDSEQTGLFLGAGASAEIGMPLVSGLTGELKDWLTPRRQEIHLRGRFPAHVVNDFVAMLSRTDTHYEALIGYLEIQVIRMEQFRNDYHSLLNWLIHMVHGILLLNHVNRLDFIEERLQLLDGIIGLAKRNKPLWIFSLNHDLIIDCLAMKYGIPLNAGLWERSSLPRYVEGKLVGELPVEILTRNEIEKRGLRFLQPGEYGINLLKVHGGLDVYMRNDARDMVRVLPVAPTVKGVIDALTILNREVTYPHPILGSAVRAGNEIIYADTQGEMQFLQRSLVTGVFKYVNGRHQIMPSEYMSIFQDNLKRLNRLIVIGYGFGDAHVNKAIREWLESAECHHLEIISPNAIVPACILHLSLQIEEHRTSGSKYLAQFSPTKSLVLP